MNLNLLKWKNDSSFVVQWFYITELGSVGADLRPGDEHSMPNDPGVKSVGILIPKGPVHVINNLETEFDSELIAADIIPAASAFPDVANPASKRTGRVVSAPGRS